MKTTAVSVSLLALGVASSYAIYAPELTRIETGKPWTVAASLRGFYDDNWACQPDWVNEKSDSFGFEARPFIGFNMPMESSYLGLSYLNSSRYYEARPNNDWDFTHDFGLKFDHAFSPRYRLKVTDSFLYGSEPDVVGVVSMPFQRMDLTYYRNLADVTFSGELTEVLGFALGYKNTFYNYDDSGDNSYNALLNRIEHAVPIDLRYQFQPDLVGLVGYQFGMFDYTSSYLIADGLPADSRNLMSHAIYVGADYDITSTLRAGLRVGAQYASYDSYGSQDQWTPYVDGSLSYYYTTGSHIDFGVKNMISPTDVYYTDGNTPTLNIEALSFYALVSHQFTPKLTANLLAQYQYSSFYGGLYDGQNEGLLLLGLYASYQINQYFSVEAGYNFDWLDSDIKNADGLDARTYDRNRVFIGVRAQY
jgi:hypothetical protein